MDTAKYRLDRTRFGDSANKGKLPTLQETMTLLDDWVKNERLKLHMLQVGEVLFSWALEREGLSDVEAVLWKIAGLLHDADWERWPDEHCRRIVEYLEEKGYDPDLIRAIASHSPSFFGVEPQSRLDHIMYAVDELSGFVHAVTLVRPEGYAGMNAKSVIKKLKTPAFAAQVNREEIADACARAGLGLNDLITFIIEHQSSVTVKK